MLTTCSSLLRNEPPKRTPAEANAHEVEETEVEMVSAGLDPLENFGIVCRNIFRDLLFHLLLFAVRECDIFKIWILYECD